jgi:Cu+-exporting ATPase
VIFFSGSDAAVAAAAVALIVAVNWYFLGPRRSQQASRLEGAQSATIVVDGGYSPAVVEVEAGRPVRLTFDRRETNPCSDEVVFHTLGIRQALPAFQKTVVEFTPDGPGRIEFACGMGMLRGAVIAR